MTDVTSDTEAGKAAVSGAGTVDDGLVAELVTRAQAGGVKLTGEGGLLQQLTKRLLESALEGELTDHLGHEPGERAEGGRENYRNGHRSKRVITESGPVEIAVPRDRAGSFEPQLVKKRQRRLGGVDEMVLSLSAKGLTHGEISAYLAEVYGAEISKSTISTITDSVMAGMSEWQNRPLDTVYPVVFIDCVNVKVRDGQVANRPVYMAVAVTAEGQRDILGLWIGDGGEGAKYWLQVLTEIKNRGAADVLMLVCDGLTGLPDAVNTVWPATIVQTCVVHLLRNSFRYAARQDWEKIAKALRPVYTAPTEDASLERFVEFTDAWGGKYPAIVRLWEAAWAEFVPFLRFDVEIRKIVCTTNAIESINARIRKAVRARGHFPTDQAALKCVYLAVMSLDPTGTGRKRWTMRWKAALQAFDITFDGRLTAGRR
ncbi:IS256 family transposase (plasmid) [Streptomyces sp. BH-SS-21]|uniref:Mutator family transposase n=1 Tax=Streptomyces liliiviolaceus TaxID=2823109 RepID=A0A941BC21_9ACTN|nr:IS256 family transposase [Streptomyces liliiviolaceus]MBQ0855581.1 IS256 family transposase [Streptomyces liliiviolaceus]